MLKDHGAEMKATYLTFGQYDFVAIIEAPSDEVFARVVLALAAQGNVRTTTLKAFDEAEYRRIIAQVP